jgi:hypothetical protein
LGDEVCELLQTSDPSVFSPLRRIVVPDHSFDHGARSFGTPGDHLQLRLSNWARKKEGKMFQRARAIGAMKA